MGLFDMWMKHVQLNTAEGAWGLAQALEQAGHYGAAMRLYEIAGARFHHAGFTSNAAEFAARCREAAGRRGEDPLVARSITFEQYQHSTAEVLQWYYEQQIAAVSRRLVELAGRQDWEAVLRLAQAAQGLRQFLGRSGGLALHNQCAYYCGLSHLRMGHADRAIRLLTEVMEYVRREDNREGVAHTALTLGEAYSLAGDTRAEDLLYEAHEAFGELGAGPLGEMNQGRQRTAEAFNQYFDRMLERTACPEVVEIARRADQRAFGDVAARARSVLQADQHLRQAAQLERERQFARAAELSRQAAELAQSARCPSLKKAADVLHRDVILKDPALLPVHAKTLRGLLENDDFAPADDLLADLSARHGQAPQVEEMRNAILQAKQTRADRDVSAATGLLEARQYGAAEEAVTRARAMADSIDYEPPQYAAVRARVSNARAVALALDAQQRAAAKDFAQALRLVGEAEILPLLAQDNQAKLAALREQIARACEGEAGRCRQDIAQLLEQEKLDEAAARVEQAKAQGYADQLGPQIVRVKDCLQVRDLVQAADKDLRLRKFKECLAKVQEAWALPSCRPLQEKLRTLHAGVRRWMEIVRANYTGGDQRGATGPLSFWAGFLAAGGVFYLLYSAGGHGFFLALWEGLALAVALPEGLYVVLRRKPFAHNGDCHAMSLALGGVALFLTTLVLRASGSGAWMAVGVGVAVAIAVLTMVGWFLGRTCPATKPIDVPPLPEQDSAK